MAIPVWGTVIGECAWCLEAPATTSYKSEDSQGDKVAYQVCAECKENME
jgi:hypothetical protein